MSQPQAASNGLPLALVVGVTNLQGYVVAKKLIESKKYRVRGVTVETEASEKWNFVKKELPALELMHVKRENHADIEKMLKDVNSAFFCTDCYWHVAEHTEAAAQKELTKVKEIIDATKKAGVKKVVFSSNVSADKISGGKIKIPFFDVKAQMSEYLLASGIPAVVLNHPHYFENFLKVEKPRKIGELWGALALHTKDQAGGLIYIQQISEEKYELRLPIPTDTKINGMSVWDLGELVEKAFANFDEYKGKTMNIATCDLTLTEYASILSKILGKNVVYTPITMEQYKIFSQNEEFAHIFQFLTEYGSMIKYDVSGTKKHLTHPKTFDAFVTEHKPDILKKMEAMKPVPAIAANKA